MRTPDSWNKALAARLLTGDVLEACLFSANKRAKNCRDSEREARGRYGRGRWNRHAYDKYGSEQRSRSAKEAWYAKKDLLLSVLEPSCVHRELQGYERERVYDYEDGYDRLERSGAFVWENCYFDRDLGREVWFGDVELKDEPRYGWYLFYDCLDGHTFHTPIEEGDVGRVCEGRGLEVVPIDRLDTHGEEPAVLASPPVVAKACALVSSGDFELCLGETAPEALASHGVPEMRRGGSWTKKAMLESAGPVSEALHALPADDLRWLLLRPVEGAADGLLVVDTGAAAVLSELEPGELARLSAERPGTAQEEAPSKDGRWIARWGFGEHSWGKKGAGTVSGAWFTPDMGGPRKRIDGKAFELVRPLSEVEPSEVPVRGLYASDDKLYWADAWDGHGPLLRVPADPKRQRTYKGIVGGSLNRFFEGTEAWPELDDERAVAWALEHVPEGDPLAAALRELDAPLPAAATTHGDPWEG